MDFQKIVLIVLGILYFYFRNSGKDSKSNKKAPKPGSEGSTPSLEDIIRELSGQTSAPKPVVRQEVKPSATKSRKHVTPDMSEHEDYRKTINTTRRVNKVVIPKNVQLDEEVHSDEHFDFDLRQAVINDAILNRPYQ